jgi:hypothetical protein
MAQRRWSAETDKVLREAGWPPGRQVATEEWERTTGDEALEKLVEGVQ